LVEISGCKKLSDYAGIDINAFLQDGQYAKVQVSSLFNTYKISADAPVHLQFVRFFLESYAFVSVVSSTYVHVWPPRSVSSTCLITALAQAITIPVTNKMNDRWDVVNTAAPARCCAAVG
jgi:hypothetical protein